MCLLMDVLSCFETPGKCVARASVCVVLFTVTKQRQHRSLLDDNLYTHL